MARGRGGKTSRRAIQARERWGRAAALKAEGKSLAEIAQIEGYSGPSGAHYAVSQAMKECMAAGVEAHRERQWAELERVKKPLWGPTDAGDTEAAKVVMTAIRADMELWGTKVNEGKLADAAGVAATASALQVTQTFSVIQQALSDPRLALSPDQLALVPIVLGEYLERADITTNDDESDTVDGVAWDTGTPTTKEEPWPTDQS